MKKILYLLFAFQLIITSIYGINVFRQVQRHDLMYHNQTALVINFDEGAETTEKFGAYLKSLADSKEVYISKYVHPKAGNIVIYTTDLSMGNKINLQEGMLPAFNSDAILGDIDTGKLEQSGTFSKIDPNVDITIKSMYNVAEIGSAGIYHISTTDCDTINTILGEFDSNEICAEIFHQYDSLAFFTDFNFEFLIAFFSVLLSVLFSVIQYSAGKLKKISILSIHGYDLGKITKLTAFETVKILSLAGISAYVLVGIYYVLENSFNFFIELSVLYLCLLVFLIMIYTAIVNVFIAFYFKKRNNIKILKGSKPFTLIAFFQYAIKIMFVFLLATSLINIVETSNLWHEKISNLQTWDKAQNIYTTRVRYTGGDLDLTLADKMAAFYKDMEKYHNGFVINTNNYAKTGNRYSYELNKKEGIPSEASPHGKSIIISENYLKINPIEALEKYSISDMIVRDDNVLNILVPQKLKTYENIILGEYLDHFYSQKIRTDNIYNEALGKELNDTKREDLKINIIYVEDNQTYFTFRESIVPEQNNLITDPVAKIYTANTHSSYAFSHITGCFYFYTESKDPYGEIYPLIAGNGLISSIRRVLSVYDEYGKEIQELQQTYRNIIMLIMVLLISSIAITYNLVASYYEKNKYKLYIKKIYGYSFFKKNKVMVALVLTVNLIPVICMGVFANYNLVLLGILGLVVMLVEFISLRTFDFMLERKSFNNIIKGEH